MVRLLQIVTLVAAVQCLSAGAQTIIGSGIVPQVEPCGTQLVWERHAQMRKIDANYPLPNGCNGQGPCDDPEKRYAASQASKKIPFVFNLMCSPSGEYPDGVTPGDLEAYFNILNEDYSSYSIEFELVGVNLHFNQSWYELPPYGLTDDWYNVMMEMKEATAVSPSTTLNVYVGRQEGSVFGTLLGIATFPWDPIALTAKGGLWLNSITTTAKYQEDGDRTLQHEVGHCLGLWHTFHGVEEVPLGCKSACYEHPHASNNFSANWVGDFCADTPGTPRSYECTYPGGQDCDDTAWGATDFTNFMGYGLFCQKHFSTEQAERMHCWICDALSSWNANGCPSNKGKP